MLYALNKIGFLEVSLWVAKAISPVGDNKLLIDVIVYFHLLFVAIGLGLAVRLDFIFFRGRHARPSQVLLADTALSHQMISTALVGLWGSGICLIYMRTGFALEAFSPKLWIKLIIVSLLSVNAIIIGIFVMPVMERYKDRPVLDIPIRYKLPMAVSAATSAFCWFTALALGAMTTLKTQSWGTLGTVFGIEYALGMMVAVSLALWARTPKLPPLPVERADTSVEAQPETT